MCVTHIAKKLTRILLHIDKNVHQSMSQEFQICLFHKQEVKNKLPQHDKNKLNFSRCKSWHHSANSVDLQLLLFWVVALWKMPSNKIFSWTLHICNSSLHVCHPWLLARELLASQMYVCMGHYQNMVANLSFFLSWKWSSNSKCRVGGVIQNVKKVICI